MKHRKMKMYLKPEIRKANVGECTKGHDFQNKVNNSMNVVDNRQDINRNQMLLQKYNKMVPKKSEYENQQNISSKISGSNTLYQRKADISSIIQLTKKSRITLGIVGTLLTAGVIWLSPKFRAFMKDAWRDSKYREKLENNEFRIEAGLQQYCDAFGDGFKEQIQSMGEEEYWLDGGAGVGQAISDYYDGNGKAKTIAVGYKKPEHDTIRKLENESRFKYLSGKYFQEFADKEDLLRGSNQEGKMSVITDFNGVLSYTETLSEDLQKYLNNLKVGGKIYTTFYAKIDDEYDVLEWLKKCTGITVERKAGSIVITKVQNEAKVVSLELLQHQEAKSSNIPDRIYKCK